MLEKIFCFPFEQIGSLLSGVAKLGALGNGLSLCLLAIISLIPLLAALVSIKDTRKLKENIVLILLSPLTAFTLYSFTNTKIIMSHPMAAAGDFTVIVKAALGCSLWSGIVSYFVLFLLRLLQSADKEKLMKYIKAAAVFLSAFFAIMLLFVSFPGLLSALDSAATGADSFKAYLAFTADALTYILDILVTMSAAKLIDTVLLGADSVSIKEKADLLSKRSVGALSIIIISGFICNAAQVVLLKELTNISTTVWLPLLSIFFVATTLLLSRLVTENKELKEDNDLFV